MIKHIVFDLGQVLLRFSPTDIARNAGISPKDQPLFLREVFQNIEWISLDRGSMPEETAIDRICSRLPARLHPAVREVVQGWWKHPLHPIPGMAELARELKDLGCGIYLLSNAPSNLHQYFQRIPGSECFDGMIVSGDWKLLKPQREIYETLFSQFSLYPGDCIFIDDSPLNIDGAICAGMAGIVFTGDIRRLRQDLNSAGIPVCCE